MEDKRKINIVFADNKVDNAVLEYLKCSYDITIVKDYLALDRKKAPLVDLIVFTGGADVSPYHYGENRGKYTHSDETRDVTEKRTFDFQRNITNKIPKLGICRGAQMLTVLNGGKLIQHVENHKNSKHLIELRNGNTLEIPSDHHQMMFPYSLNSEKYELLGWSRNHMSNVYLNGENENIELPKKFLEPEIVYYKNTNSFCIQAHPEWDINCSSSQYLLKQIDFWLFKNNKNQVEEPYYIENNLNIVAEESDFKNAFSSDEQQEPSKKYKEFKKVEISFKELIEKI